MYRLIIVDDEPYVLRGLRTVIDWASYGIEIVGEASNGEIALELMRDKEPELIMTDIYMPRMDGLALIAHQRELLPGAKVILLSGYADFEYARKAIAENVFAYLLKPIETDSLISVVKRVTAELDQERRKSDQDARLREQLEQSLPTLKERYLRYVLNGTYRLDYALEAGRRLGLSIRLTPCPSVVFLVEFDSASRANLDEYGLQLAAVGVTNVIRSELERFGHEGEIVEEQPGRFAVVLNLPHAEGSELTSVLDGLAQRIHEAARTEHDLSITVGVGGICPDASSIPESYREATQAIDYSIFPETGSIIHYRDVSSTGAERLPTYPLRMESSLLTAVRLGDVEEAISVAGEFIETVTHRDNRSPQELRRSVLKVTYAVLKNAIEWDASSDLLAQERVMESAVDKSGSVDSLREHLVNFVRRATTLKAAYNARASKHTTRLVYDFIHANYQRDIGLQDIADAVGVTPNYLANKFKQETGGTIIAYLTEYRMNEARKLLSETTLKVYEIAERIGYTNPNYFCHVFKKEAGSSPGAYRNSQTP